MESFFRSYKVEEVYWATYETHEQATRGVVEYIDRFYNRVRRHSSLDYVSPIEFEQQRLFESKPVGQGLPSSEPFVGRSQADGDRQCDREGQTATCLGW